MKSLLRYLTKRIKPTPDPPSTKRAMESLRDPKWSWNKFPRKHINYISYTTRHPFRSVRLSCYKILERIWE